MANYPWDGSPNKTQEYEACPDDGTYRYLAKTYATQHRDMSDPANKVRLPREGKEDPADLNQVAACAVQPASALDARPGPGERGAGAGHTDPGG